VEQKTNYPWDGKVTITVNPKTPATFALNVRIPKRDVSSLYHAVPNGDGIGALKLNGAAIKISGQNGYVSVQRQWKKGDTIAFTLPMPIQRVYGSDKIVGGGTLPPPVKDKVALRVGPIVYNIEQVDQDIAKTLPPTAPLKTEWRGDFLNGVAVITSTFADGAPMTAIPNFARYNRNPPAPPPPPPAPPAPPPVAGAPPAPRPAPPPVTSKIWIQER